MKCISIRFLLVLAMSMGAYAQSAPQVQAILDRLDQLEKDNQALLEEVRALRQGFRCCMRRQLRKPPMSVRR
jgi:hypothetical protein